MVARRQSLPKDTNNSSSSVQGNARSFCPPVSSGSCLPCPTLSPPGCAFPKDVPQPSALSEPYGLTTLFDRPNSPSCQAHCPSEQATVLQVVLDDDVSDGIKHKLHVLGVGGACEVRVDLLGVFAFIQVLKFALDVAGCLVILVGP